MSIQTLTSAAVDQIATTTPPNVQPTVHVQEPSAPARWSVITLIGAMLGSFGVVVYVVLHVFDAIIFTKSETIVLAQFANQKSIALALIAIHALIIAGFVWMVTRLRVAAQVGAMKLDLGGVSTPSPEPVTVDVTAPQGTPVVVNAAPPIVTTHEAPAEDADMAVPESSPPKQPPLPLKGYPNEYGD